MERLLDRLPPGARVAVIRLRSMGDCVLTTPALEILKRARPDLELGVVVEDRFAALFQGNPDVAAVLPPLAITLARWRPALCLNLHGGARSVRLTLASRARWRAGFAHFRGAALYNVRIPRAQEILGLDRKVHTAEHLACAAFYLGAPAGEIPRAKLFAPPRESAGSYAVLHPTASADDKTWPAERFHAVAEHLERAHGLEPVFIAGAGEDVAAFGRWRTAAGRPLAEVMSLIAGAALFAGNDSGPAHVAAAFQVPLVVLFGSSDPVIWAPWKAPAQVLTSPRGIAGIETETVLAALDRLRVAA